jgi:predicted XRE-type DNA-binding protein
MAAKPLCWVGSSRDDVRAFPDDARRAAGYEPGRVQEGLMPTDWRPMATVGLGAYEIRVHTRLEHRVFYVMTIKIRRSSGNVFRDLGFSREESENLKIRGNLMIRLSRLIEARKLTQAQAATLFGVTQPRVSDLVRGKIDRFSIDTLVAMLGHAGVRVQIVVGRVSNVA